MTNILITGAAGRMGRNLITAVYEAQGSKLTAATERRGSSMIGVDTGELAGLEKNNVVLIDDINNALDQFDVCIDFTAPAVTIENIKACRSAGRKMVIGTTGFTDDQKQVIQDAA